jgi:hypothetical protein
MPAPDARSGGPATGLQTPVLLILFNRPELTARVFSEIAAQRPATLFVAGDGPRNAADVDRCQEARRVIERVDWPCDVRTNFAVRNLGAGLGPATALDWVFSQVDEAIILEDDCVPAPSFFAFAEALLQRYRHDPRVMEIGGGNYQFGRRHTPYSYYFSHYAHTNGWATWRRAWDRFDLQIARWPEYRATRLVDAVCDNPAERRYWTYIFDRIAAGHFTSSWDYQWMLACWAHGGLVAVPEVNLVSNHGYGPDATHTRSSSILAAMPTGELGEIRHPPDVTRHAGADTAMFRTCFGGGMTRAGYGVRTAGATIRALFSRRS